MKKTIPILFSLGLSFAVLTGCSNTQLGAMAGGAAGAGIGYAVSGGSALGTAIGAGAGVLVGGSLGAEADRRDAYYGYYY